MKKLPQIFNLNHKISPTNKDKTIVEVTLLSAQDLPTRQESSSFLRTYVVAYLDPKQKLVSPVDHTGDSNPRWNHKFVFAIDNDLASRRPNACIIFEIYRGRRIKKDKKIGVVHVLVQSLVPKNDGDKTYMAFNVRSTVADEAPPAPILNVGVMKFGNVFSWFP